MRLTAYYHDGRRVRAATKELPDTIAEHKWPYWAEKLAKGALMGWMVKRYTGRTL